VAAAVASVTAAAFEREGIPGGAQIGALVFLTISVTVVLAGLTAGPVATLLRLRLPSRDTIAILGARGLGFLLGRELRDAGASVIFIDANAENCRRAEEAGFTVVFGDGLQERTLLRARFELVGDVVGATANQMLNSVFVSRAREGFRVPRSYVAVARPESGLAPELVRLEQATVLFDGPHDTARWEVRERHGDVITEQWEFTSAPAAAGDSPDPSEPPRATETFVILMIRRDGKPLLMQQGVAFEAGDVATVAIHTEEDSAARDALARSGWVPHQLPPPDESAPSAG
jgi:xanthosine utilization system XapX-like protein